MSPEITRRGGGLQKIMSVGQLVKGIRAMVDSQGLHSLMIRGEVLDTPRRNFYSGHLYFSLGDSICTIQCIVFNNHLEQLDYLPEQGDEIFIRADASIYEKSGQITLRVYDARPVGAGSRTAATNSLVERLTEEGLFSAERKRRLNPFPKHIGVIAAPNSAALEDIKRTLADRNPLVTLHIYPATMQGENCCGNVARAINIANEEAVCDTLIIARGGGSSDDLSGFNAEQLVRAVADSRIPTISAIGHEIDISLVDMAADLRVATPTAAIIAAVCSKDELNGKISSCKLRLRHCINSKLAELEQKLDILSGLLNASSPTQKLINSELRLKILTEELHSAIDTKLTAAQHRLALLLVSLEALNPLQLLSQGYSLLYSEDNSIVKSTDRLNVGDRLTAKTADGELVLTVAEISK